MSQRLYKVIVVELPGEGDWEWEPDGWGRWLDENWAPTADTYDDPPVFAWPNERKVYRSRSAATAALRRFEQWGAVAYLAEAEPVWVSVAEANANRARSRREARIGKLRAEIARLEVEA